MPLFLNTDCRVDAEKKVLRKGSGVISISAIRACDAAAFDDGRKKLKFSKKKNSNFFSLNFCQMLQISANLRLSTQNVVKKRFLDEKVIFWRKMYGTIFSKV